MATSRRDFLKLVGAAAAAGATCPVMARAAMEPGEFAHRKGMLSDLSVCIGCRKCEFACQEANGLPHSGMETFEDQSVFEQQRRPDVEHFTVVNRFAKDGHHPATASADTRPETHSTDPAVATRDSGAVPYVYVKKQCMHCNAPACASACPVAALRKTPEGPVIYDASRCIGCRYCLMACPFSIPAYTYDDGLTPVVRKCVLCFERISRQGGVPACATICPVEAITYGERGELLALARAKLREQPDRYVNHIYGESEVGGTSWMYVSPQPFDELAFRTDLGTRPYPERTAGFLSVVPLVLSIWPAVLVSAHFLTKGHRRRKPEEDQRVGADPSAESPRPQTPAPVAEASNRDLPAKGA